MTIKEVREKLKGIVDTVSHKNGVFTVRLGFFYRHGHTSAQLAETIMAAIPGAEVIDHWETWKDFKGGASIAAQSHWGAKFTTPN
jgi:hypothetical protein